MFPYSREQRETLLEISRTWGEATCLRQGKRRTEQQTTKSVAPKQYIAILKGFQDDKQRKM